MDDLFEGWSGLAPDLWERLREGVLEPLSAGRPGRYRRYDWHAERFAEEHPVPPSDVVIVEGVGAGARQVDDRAVLRIWVEAPRDLRLARGIERDGELMRENWLRWAEREDAHFRSDRTRDRADVVLDGQAALDG
jgi:uridine kinase